MAHGTKINGTNYGISGGMTKINGASYNISNGMTKVGGTGYNIPFGPCTFTVQVVSGTTRIEIPYYFESGMTWNDFVTGSTDYRKAYYDNDTNGLENMAHGFYCASGVVQGCFTIGCTLQEGSDYPAYLGVLDYDIGDFIGAGVISDPNGQDVLIGDSIIQDAVYYAIYFRA